MHIPIGLGLAIYAVIVARDLFRKWKIERAARRTFAVGAGLTGEQK